MSSIDYGVYYGEKKVIEKASNSCFDKTNSRTLVSNAESGAAAVHP